MRAMLSIAIAIASLLGLAGAASAQTNRLPVEVLHNELIGESAVVNVTPPVVGGVPAILVFYVYEQKEGAFIDGEISILLPNNRTVRAHTFGGDNFEPTLWVRTKTLIEVDGLRFQEMLLKSDGSVWVNYVPPGESKEVLRPFGRLQRRG